MESATLLEQASHLDPPGISYDAGHAAGRNRL
jgi:hypothetical protein